jgi:enoyl-CoA hydratase/carnithine racemase
MSYETLVLDVEDGVGTVTLNRPEKLNAYTPRMGQELPRALGELDRDPAVRVVVLTGAGRAFCAGADMSMFESQIEAGGGTGAGGAEGPTRVEEFPLLMRRLTKPSIAAINGYALGVGATMTLLCDVRLAAHEARVGFLFPRMGVMAELGSTFLLPRLVGLGRACELMLSGKIYEAAELERCGLINHVYPSAELATRARELAGEMAQCAPLSVQLTRQALYQGLQETFEAQVRYEGFALDYLYRSRDHAEAVAAFRAKRKPNFEGR